MISRQFSLLFLVVAAALATPGGLFASIESATDIPSAQREYLSEVDGIIAEAKKTHGDKIKQGVIDNILKMAKENSQKVYSAEEVAEAKKEAEAAKEKEQSTANKMLGGLTMAATGIGGMQLMQGLAEKKADEAAAADMAAYLKTIKCGVSGGLRNINYNDVGTTPEESRELADARLNYTVIAKKIKIAKESLGMAPGIESELIIDTSQGLYDNAGTETDGIAHHFDTGTERAASGSGKKRAIVGGVLAGAGVVGGVVGNAIINKKDDGDGEKKDEKKESGGGGLGGALSGLTSKLGGG